MTLYVRDGTLDVALITGPGLAYWPTVGVRVISSLCAESGLTVGQFGGGITEVRGVIPNPQTGACVLAQDSQERIHRIEARSIVRWRPDTEMPDPFIGWASEGLIPLQTAARLNQNPDYPWDHGVVILGTGNKAFRFGSALLEEGRARNVYCLDRQKVHCWEVERRRFEILGGKVIFGEPLELKEVGPQRWSLRVKDAVGTRVIDCSAVVSAGPFAELPAVREFPPGSNLFEILNTARPKLQDDVEGWIREEENARLLGARIVRNLVSDLKDNRSRIEDANRKAKQRLKALDSSRTEPFSLDMEGKWVASETLKKIRNHPGVPKIEYQQRLVASIECIEPIACKECEKSCPENAISIQRSESEEVRFLVEKNCTACGLCLTACPSKIPVLLTEPVSGSEGKVTLPHAGPSSIKPGDLVHLLNRKGDVLGSGPVAEIIAQTEKPNGERLVSLKVPSHLVWEVRGFREKKKEVIDEAWMRSLSYSTLPESVEILVNGTKRRARRGSLLIEALFAMGHARSKDVLWCRDGNCQLCGLTVDGVKKLACETTVRKGMAVKFETSERPDTRDPGEEVLCPCLDIRVNEVRHRIEQGKLRSAAAVLERLPVGEGRCHGQRCGESFRRLLVRAGLEETQNWIDWRFPSSEWRLKL